MIVGFLGGMTSLVMMHPNNLVVLFVILLVSQAVGRDYTRERRGIFDKAIHDFVGQDVFKAEMATLTVAGAIDGNWDWCG